MVRGVQREVHLKHGLLCLGHSSNAGIFLHVRTQKRSSQRAPKFEDFAQEDAFLRQSGGQHELRLWASDAHRTLLSRLHGAQAWPGTPAKLLTRLSSEMRPAAELCAAAWPLRAQEFKECVATETDFSKCLDLREDYMECLHHKKEVRALRQEAQSRRPAEACAARSAARVLVCVGR